MVEQVTSQPVDPHALLESLDPMLGKQGNMKNLEEVDRIVGLMHESQKMVSRCIYLNVIKSTTDQEVLQKFITVGGWDILNTWLQEAKAENNIPLLTEILKVYNEMPVTLELLKQNNCAKTIKHLMKLADHDIKNLSSAIVECWKKAIKTKNEDKPKKKSKKHHHRHEHQKSITGDHDNHGNHDNNDLLENNTRPGSPDNNSNDSCDRVSEDSKESASSNTSINAKPKTCKTAPSKIRSTGLEVETKLEPTSKKKLSAANNKDKLPFKKQSFAKPTPAVGEKRPLSSIVTSLPISTSLTETSNKMKLVAPKRPTISELYDGSGFMDALEQAATSHVVRKKRRISNEKGAVLPGKAPRKVPTSPDEKKPLVLLDKNSSLNPALTPTPTLMPTSPEDKKPILPSFYKETLNTSEDNGHQEAEDSLPSDQVEQAADEESVATSNDIEMEEVNNCESKDGDAERPENSETSSVTSETPGLVRRKKRKRVHWVDDAVLESFYYFEMDETERVNVNRVKDFNENKRQELMLERQALQSVRKHSNDNMVEKISWFRPLPISDLPSLSVSGCNSQERQYQKERELSVLQALYFNKDMVPDSPNEPDPENYEPSEPRVMPLDDVTGESGEVTHTSYPAPVAPKKDLPPTTAPAKKKNFSLPADVAQILANITQSVKETDAKDRRQKPSHTMYAGGATKEALEAAASALPPEMQQMLTAMAQQSTVSSEVHNHVPGGPLPPHIEGFIQHLKMSNRYPEGIVERFKQILSMMPLSSASIPPNALGTMAPGLLGYAPPGPPRAVNGPIPRVPRYPGDRPPRPEVWHGNPMVGHGPPNMGHGPPPQWGGPGMPMMSGPPPPLGPPPGPPRPPPMMRGPPPRGRGRGNPPICRFFMSGTCSASHCRYIHPGITGPPL